MRIFLKPHRSAHDIITVFYKAFYFTLRKLKYDVNCENIASHHQFRREAVKIAYHQPMLAGRPMLMKGKLRR